MTRETEHKCHALGCDRRVPPRMHQCGTHWAMVPKPLQRALWANYRRGQENRMDPTPAYLRAAAACVEAVALKEGFSREAIDLELSAYLAWAELIEGDDE